ncbi:YIP1 family protein [Bacillus sp. UMB0893]|uniref:YIP1 family protein n=1 Tax=Bacillus sp. UMB0893 TaxID=2066053 RepID=UPI000C75A70F|nr:YIP1 family protein [Bacillus sp. UMB0893]PLR67420.1 hypothetical protein CYJ36_12195 [Bacillus sp. UMB0893]
MKRIIVLLSVFIVLMLPANVLAKSPYVTWTIGSDGNWTITQDGYLPTGTMNGLSALGDVENQGQMRNDLPLSQPDDLYIDKMDQMYIADTGNARIAVLSPDGVFLKSIGEGTLSQPTGVFVHENEHIFVADYGNQMIYEFDQQGKKINEYGKPSSVLFGEKTDFTPKKVIVDKRGNIYAVLEGATEGLAQISSKGEFLGYFGANQTGFDMTRAVQKIFYSQEQLKKLQSKLPPSATNLAIDDEGLIYTSTNGVKENGLKKLNISGSNLIPSTWTTRNISDITVDFMGNIFAVDSADGSVYEYDSNGNMVFSFSGTDLGNQRLGLTKAPSSIAVNTKGRIFILDKQRGVIQGFKPTEYANLVHMAMSFYAEGKYEESETYWKEVLKYNSMFGLAHLGLGMAAFKKGEYEEALNKFVISNDVEGYSNAYWEIRRQWMIDNISSILLISAGGILFVYLLRYLYRKKGFGQDAVRIYQSFKNRKYASQFFHNFRIMRHPIDGYYELVHLKKGSVLVASILYILLFIVYIFDLHYTNFLFSGVDTRKVNIMNEFYKIFVPITAWITANYLVSTINDGKGKFKHVYMGTAYALSPYILLGIPIAVMSNGLTLMETVIYDIAKNGTALWSVILMFLMVKEVHHFELGQTVKNIMLTFSGMLVMGFLAFIMFGLSNQVIDFVYAIFQEVRARV